MRINNLSRVWTFRWTKGIKPRLGLDMNYRGKRSSDVKIEIVIPCLSKDLVTLPLVIESLRKFLKHPLGNIYIVGPRRAQSLRDFCEENGCQFIDEEKVAPLPAQDLKYRPNGVDRAGWIYQQLIKLAAGDLVKTDNFMVWDADTVLLKPQAYLDNGKFIINHSDEFHLPYRRAYQIIMGEPAVSKVSFISHQMVISKKILNELKKKIEKKNNKDWWQVILNSLDPKESSSFSEYELYGNFLNKYYPKSFILEYWFNNNTIGRKNLMSIETARVKFAKKYKSVSWHSYN